MDRLNLPRALKANLHEVGRSGGNRDLYIELDRGLLQGIRRQFYDVISRARFAPGHWGRSNPLDEFLERDRLERRLRYCIVRLRESGVPCNRQVGLLERSVSLVLKSLLESGEVPSHWESNGSDIASVDEVIARKVSLCFAPWYYPDHVLQYEILGEHELIFWKTSVDAWALSNLGEYARKLSTFSLLLFLLGIEFNFARSNGRSRYPTKDLAAELMKGEGQPASIRRSGLPKALSWYGIVEGDHGHNFHLSEFGHQLLGAALRRSDEMRDLVLLLTEVEHYGVKLSSEDGAAIFEEELSSSLLSESEKTSLSTVLLLRRSGNTLDALRLIFPLIEATLNSALTSLSLSGAGQTGMRAKIDQLVKMGLLSPGLGNLTEIVVARNKSVHGNLDNRDDLLDPLYAFVAGVFRDMLNELRGTKMGVGG